MVWFKGERIKKKKVEKGKTLVIPHCLSHRSAHQRFCISSNEDEKDNSSSSLGIELLTAFVIWTVPNCLAALFSLPGVAAVCVTAEGGFPLTEELCARGGCSGAPRTPDCALDSSPRVG